MPLREKLNYDTLTASGKKNDESDSRKEDMCKIRKVMSLDNLRERFLSRGFSGAAVVDASTVRIESLKFCDVLLKWYAKSSSWRYLIYARGKQPGVRDWAIETARKVGKGKFAGLSVCAGRPDKEGDGARVVVMFDGSVDDNRSDDIVYDALVESYEKLRENLLRNGILETKPKQERVVEYVPSVQEISHLLDGLPKAIRVEAEQYVTTIKRNVLMKIDSKLQAECRRYYAENKKVLDFIFDYGKMGLKGDVDEALASLAAQGVISHESEDGELDFTLPALDRYLCKNGVRAYRCFVDGAWAGSEQVCAVMSLQLSGDEAMDDLTMRFRERMTGEPWETNRQGELKPLMNLPWYGKNGKTGKKNWKQFSLSQDGEPLSSAVEAAVREFVVKGIPKILECLREM